MAESVRLPRSAWLAVGAVVGALAVAAGAPAPGLLAICSGLSLAALAARWIAFRGPDGQRGPVRSGSTAVAGIALTVGVLIVLGRAALAGGWTAGGWTAGGWTAGGWTAGRPASADRPTSWLDAHGRRSAIVLSIGAPKAAEQIALIELDPGADDPAGAGTVSVEALLPRYPQVEPGDVIAISGAIRPPGDDDYGAYLRQVGAAGTLRSPTLQRLGGPTGVMGLLSAIRQGSGDALARALPEPQAGLASGILIGLRDRVDRDLAAAFTTAGVSHIVAISGWNIAIVAALVGALLGRAGPRTRTTVCLLAIIAYTLVAGASPSVDRAAVMATIGLTARAGGRSSPALAALGWAIVVLLLVDPGTVLDPGFELSGLATAGLIAWTPRLTARLGMLRIDDRGLPSWLAESLAISLAAEASTLPIVLATFGRLSLVAPLANLVIVPLVPAAMAAGAVALAAGWLAAAGLPQVIVIVLGLPAWAALGLMIWLVRAAAGLPFASVTLAAPWNLAGAGLATAVVVAAVAGPGVLRRNDSVRAPRTGPT